MFTSDKGSDLAYKAELSWEPIKELRVRASYQRAVRAPNFGELFSGGSAFPQIFDPCSVTTAFRTEGGAAATAFCVANGVNASGRTFRASGRAGSARLCRNTDLEPEKADTITAGLVFQKWGFTGSIDYYNINIKKPIFGPDPNLFIAACFGYLGDFNAALDESNVFCDTIIRSGGQISFLAAPPEAEFEAIGIEGFGGDFTSNFILQNFGKVKTSGIDFQLAYALPTDFAVPASKLNLQLLLNYLIDFKVEELPGVLLDYSDTVSYFGQGLGTSFPTAVEGYAERGLDDEPNHAIDPRSLHRRHEEPCVSAVCERGRRVHRDTCSVVFRLRRRGEYQGLLRCGSASTTRSTSSRRPTLRTCSRAPTRRCTT